MVMNWKNLEGRVYEFDGNKELSDEELDKLKKLDSVESVERRCDAHPQGVSYYYRLVLKDKADMIGRLPEELTEIIPSGYCQVRHPARLIGYCGDVTSVRIHTRRKLKTAEIAQIEENSNVVYFEDLSPDEKTPLYSAGLNIPETSVSSLKSVENELSKISSVICLTKWEKTEMF